MSGPEQWKNPKLAIDALQELNSRYKSAYELVIVGDFDETARQNLAGSIQNPHVLQFRRHLSDPELIALYRHAIAVILPAYLEGFPFPISRRRFVDVQSWHLPALHTQNSFRIPRLYFQQRV